MSSKIVFLLLVCFAVNLLFVQAKWEGKKCVQGKNYNDGCNGCSCATNRQNEEGIWEPIIACTLKACFNTDGSIMAAQDPPADFWEQ